MDGYAVSIRTWTTAPAPDSKVARRLSWVGPAVRVACLAALLSAAPLPAFAREPTAAGAIDPPGLRAAFAAAIAAERTEEARLVAFDGATGDAFGVEVALDGDVAVVGASGADIAGAANQGAAYVISRSDGLWSAQQKLQAFDGAAGDQFGIDVAIDGTTAVVGAWRAEVGSAVDQGVAYVFVRNAMGVWLSQAKLTAFDGAAGDGFGFAVSISADTILVGAPQAANSGAAYVFLRSGTAWTQQAKLVAADGAAGDGLGHSVAVSGDTALLGARGDTVGAVTNQGSARVFARAGGVWSAQATLLAPDGVAGDSFGEAVALAGDVAVVGAHFDDVAGVADAGSAHAFERSGTQWRHTAQLVSGDGALFDLFGSAVAIDGSRIVVGAYAADPGGQTDQGAAWLFARAAGTWVRQGRLTAPDGAAGDFFGSGVAVSGTTVLVGASGDDVGGNANQGSASVFAVADSPAGDAFAISVALDGDTALVGAWRDDSAGNTDQGAAYVFVRGGATWRLQDRLVASDGAAGDHFGWSVALAGDTALVGALDDDVDGRVDQGSAHVFVRSGGLWHRQASFAAADGAAGDAFGSAAALAGDTALVGAWLDDIGAVADQGSAWVFTRSGTSWTPQAKLSVADGATFDSFGIAVALGADRAVVGAPDDNVSMTTGGSAFVFVRSGASWSLERRVNGLLGGPDERFGRSVALSGDTLVVGAENSYFKPTGTTGSAYVFVRSGSDWPLQAQLVAPDGATGDRFGRAVGVAGDVAVVGADADDIGASFDQGSAWVFTRSGTTWTPRQRLLATGGAAFDAFGTAVSVSGGSVLLGAPGDDVLSSVDQGSAHLFVRVGDLWIEQAALQSEAIAGYDALFGNGFEPAP